MLINKLKLTNFRNHSTFEKQFSPETNIILGPNAAGKTNILEAIHLLSSTRSFKARYDRDTIKHGEDYTRIEAEVEDEDGENDLELFIQKLPETENASIKKVKLNKVAKSLYKFAGNFNTVLFSPEDIEVLTGSPAGRRRYIDSILYQTDPEYRRNHTEYLQIVRKRNKILEKIREFGKGYDELGFWNTKVVQNGVFIQNSREILFKSLGSNAIKYDRDINKTKTRVDLRYKKSDISFDRLQEYRNKEIAAVNTLIGPHRDDFEIILDGFDAAEFASRGQQRAAILALKLAEIEYFVETTDKRPVLLLDDIFSELDEEHETLVLETIKLQQTIITATHLPDKIPSGIETINIH
jgi:DNA replication and repair protein RecF